jgi:hypothetical protein
VVNERYGDVTPTDTCLAYAQGGEHNAVVSKFTESSLAAVPTKAIEVNRVSDVKSEAWKTALSVFFGGLVVQFGWHWIARTPESTLSLFGISAGIAIFVYFSRRTDLFD